MNCYLSSKEENDAIAVHTICGMATCKKRTGKKEIDVGEGGYYYPSKNLPKKMPRMFCPDCSAAYREGI